MQRALYFIALLFISRPAFGITEIQSHVFGSGNGVASTVTHEIHFTLGQNIVGVADGVTHQIRAGFWAYSPYATSVDPDAPETSSLVDHLYQNVPNPFNPSTVIRYDIEGLGGHVRLRIYDVAGRRVRTLVNQIENPGRLNVRWNGRDDRGAAVASGIYISILETPGHRFARKLVLLR